jgi:hypothetical protein
MPAWSITAWVTKRRIGLVYSFFTGPSPSSR